MAKLGTQHVPYFNREKNDYKRDTSVAVKKQIINR